MANNVSSKSFLIYGALSLTIVLIVYYVPNYFLLETTVANHSSALLSIFGVDAPVRYVDNSVLIGDYTVARECTGIQVVAVFLGLILPLPKASIKKKIISLLILGGLVYISNILRLILEYYLVAKGILPWSLAHYPLSLVLGVFGVFFLVLINNRVLPEFGEFLFSVIGVFKDLGHRRRVEG
jgi:exosortase/archaeosortase family protein